MDGPDLLAKVGVLALQLVHLTRRVLALLEVPEDDGVEGAPPHLAAREGCLLDEDAAVGAARAEGVGLADEDEGVGLGLEALDRAPHALQSLRHGEALDRLSDRCRGGAAEDALGGGVEQLDAEVVAVAQDPVRRRRDHVPQPLLAGAQLGLGLHPLDLGARPRGEDAHHGKTPRPIRHALVVEDGEMADHRAAGIEQRDPAVAVHAPVDEPPVGGEALLETVGMMRHLAVQHRLARRAGDGELEVVEQPAAPPEGKRPEPLPILGQLRDEGVLHAERHRQVLDEGREEPLAGRGLHAFDDRPERRVLRECLPVLPVAHADCSASNTTSRVTSSRVSNGTRSRRRNVTVRPLVPRWG